ncbi:tape measure protein [Pseudomonas sp.]|uniref:tape measure protein n=1 Tax=Pseudomonas sp. TaxID=306 RepID=UPI0028AD9D05|nr:tape measure protein [Pseudomonas sp.]
MADADVQGMLIRIEATTAQLRQEIARGEAAVAQSAGKMDTSLGRIDSAFDRAGSSAQSAGGLIKNALAAAVGAVSIGTILKTADSYSQMSDRIGLATKSFGEYNTVQERLLATANRTYRPLEEAQELYIRTSDSLRSMGLNASQSMDVMDSFSYLLVTNSASADKASSAIDAYSKSLQTGKIDADAWQSILAAMPTVVDTIAQATGKTAEEIRSLGAQGKLSLDTLTEGLQKSAAANGVLADSMGVAVRDALVALNNAFTVYVGQLNESNDFTGLLASGISVLADNFGTIAEVAAVAAAGALAVYARSLTVSAAGAVLATKASIEDAMARRAQAASVLLAAQADQQKAQTAVFLAEKELAASKTRISGMAVEKQLSIQLAEARMAEARATTAVGAAQGAIVGTGRTLLGLLGGPAGIALLAVGAATAFLTLRDNTGTLEKKLGDLADPMDKLVERFDKLNRATQAVTLRELRAEIDSTKEKLAEVSGGIADKFESDLRNMGAAGADGLMSGLVSLPEDAQKALDLVRQASKDSADGIAVDWKSVADQLRLIPGVTEQMAQAIEQGQIKVSDLTETLNKQTLAFDQLSGATDNNTSAQIQNNAAKAAADAAGQKYLDQLDKQYAALKDKTALEAAERVITESKIDSEGELAKQIRARASAIDAQKAADKAATAETNLSNSAAKEAATALKNQQKALADLRAQADIAIASATGLAAAYLAGTDRSRDFALQQKVEEALLKTGAAARDEVTDKIKKQMAAEDRLAVSKAAYDLQKETTDLIAQAKATLMGADALEDYNVQKAMQVALAGKNIEVGSKEYQQLLNATKAQQDAVKVAKQAGDAGSIVDRLYPASKLLREYTEDQAALNKAIELYPEKADAYRDALQRLGVEYQQNQRAATAWGQFTEGAVDRIDDAFADMWKSVLSKSSNFMDTLKNSFRQFLAEMLHMAITKPIIVQIGASLGVGTAAAQSSGLFGSAGGSGGLDLASLWNAGSTAFSVGSSAFGSAVAAGWSAGQGFLGGVQGAISGGTGYLSNAIGGLFSSGVQGGAGVMLDSAGNLVSTAAGGATALGGTLAGVGGALYGYGQSGVKGAATGAAGSVGGYYAGSALGSLVGPLGTVVGGVLGSALGGFLGGSVFGGSWQTKDQGLSLGVAGGDLSAAQFEYQKKKGGLFGSNKKRTRYSALDSDTQAALDDSYAATTGAVFDLFDKLNVTLNDGVLDGLNVSATQISTKGKTADEIQAEITKWFAGVADSVTSAINTATGTGLDGYNFEALTAFVNNLYGVNDVFTTLNMSLYDSSVSGGKLAESLSAMAGGLANLQAAASTYYDNFYTDIEKADNVLAAVNKQFAGLNIDFPDTRQAFRDTVDGLDRTTEAGQQMFVTLTSLAANAASAYTILEQRSTAAQAAAQAAADAAAAVSANYYDLFTSDAQKSADKLAGVRAEFQALGVELPATSDAFKAMVAAAQQGTVVGNATADTLLSLATDASAAYKILQSALMQGANDGFSALQRSISAQQKVASDAYNARVNALNDMLSASSSSVSDLTSLSTSLNNALKSLRGTSDDTVKMLRAQATATLQSALAIARAGGSLANFSGLDDALDAVSSNNTDLYASLEDFNRDQGRTANVVAELNLLNGEQLTNAEKSVKALQDQLDQAKKAYEAQTAQFDAQLAFAQSQLDALNGVDTSVKTVAQAVASMNASVVAALAGISGKATAASPSTNGALVESVYNDVLGRASDAPGKAYWVGQLASGAITYDQLAQAIANAAKGAGQPVKAGYATGGYISGPGTGTSDSIIARLSNGEYVMTAESVRMFGTGLLDQMNAGRIPAFAAGGPVLDISSPREVFSANRSVLASDNASEAATVTELRELRREMQSNFEYIGRYIKDTADHTDEMANRGVQVISTVD